MPKAGFISLGCRKPCGQRGDDGDGPAPATAMNSPPPRARGKADRPSRFNAWQLHHPGTTGTIDTILEMATPIQKIRSGVAKKVDLGRLAWWERYRDKIIRADP